MNAIQRFEYDRLQRYLRELQQECEILDIPDDYLSKITLQEEKLTQLYSKYQTALLQVGTLIKEYEQEQVSIRRLMINHKQYCKSLCK